MFFLIVIGIFFGAIVFFHSLQGLFSATISAILTVLSAAIAFSYHEPVVESLLGGKVADEAHAMVLLALFGISYIVLRTIFDNVVKGNVRFPAAIDKAGAVIMGLVVAVFATGIMAIAAQELPFGATVGGYARYDMQADRALSVHTTGRSLDRTEYSELTYHGPGAFGDEGSGHGVALLPVDNIVVGTVQKLSTGALSAGKPLNSVHPDFLDELFGQRLGIETGGNHVAMNLPDKKLDTVDLVGLYSKIIPTSDQYQKDSELKELRTGGLLKPIALPPTQVFLVVRVTFKLPGADSDRLFRLSPGSVRLMVNAVDPGSNEPTFTNYFPVGTLQDARVLYLNKLDDFLFVPLREGDRGVDLVFKVNKKQFDTGKKAPAGTFLEVKRLARVDLSGQEINPANALKTNPDYNPMRKLLILTPPPAPNSEQPAAPAPETPPAPSPTPTPTPTPAPTPTPEPTSNAFQIQEAVPSDAVPTLLTAPAGTEGSLVQVPGGTAVISGGKLKVADLDSTAADQTLPVKVTQFSIPGGMSMVQVSGTPSAASPWGFAGEPEAYEVVDAAGKKYQPYGLFAKYDAKGSEWMRLRYIDGTTISGSAAPEGAGKPKQVVLFFLVPPGTALTEFDDHGQKAHDLSVTAK
jgi:hypothetical protein